MLKECSKMDIPDVYISDVGCKMYGPSVDPKNPKPLLVRKPTKTIGRAPYNLSAESDGNDKSQYRLRLQRTGTPPIVTEK